MRQIQGNFADWQVADIAEEKMPTVEAVAGEAGTQEGRNHSHGEVMQTRLHEDYGSTEK